MTKSIPSPVRTKNTDLESLDADSVSIPVVVEPNPNLDFYFDLNHVLRNPYALEFK